MFKWFKKKKSKTELEWLLDTSESSYLAGYDLAIDDVIGYLNLVNKSENLELTEYQQTKLKEFWETMKG
jgi:hypothetical protein